MDPSTFPRNIEISDEYVLAVKQVKKDFIDAAKDKKKQRMEENPNYEGYDSADEEAKAEELARIKRERGKSCRPQKAVGSQARQFSRRIRVLKQQPALINVDLEQIEDETEKEKVAELQRRRFHQSRRHDNPVRERMNMFGGQRVVRRTVRKSTRRTATPHDDKESASQLLQVSHEKQTRESVRRITTSVGDRRRKFLSASNTEEVGSETVDGSTQESSFVARPGRLRKSKFIKFQASRRLKPAIPQPEGVTTNETVINEINAPMIRKKKVSSRRRVQMNAPAVIVNTSDDSDSNVQAPPPRPRKLRMSKISRFQTQSDTTGSNVVLPNSSPRLKVRKSIRKAQPLSARVKMLQEEGEGIEEEGEDPETEELDQEKQTGKIRRKQRISVDRKYRDKFYDSFKAMGEAEAKEDSGHLILRKKRASSKRVVRVSVKNIKPLAERMGKIEKSLAESQGSLKDDKRIADVVDVSAKQKINEQEDKIIEALKVKPPTWEYTDDVLDEALNDIKSPTDTSQEVQPKTEVSPTGMSVIIDNKEKLHDAALAPKPNVSNMGSPIPKKRQTKQKASSSPSPNSLENSKKTNDQIYNIENKDEQEVPKLNDHSAERSVGIENDIGSTYPTSLLKTYSEHEPNQNAQNEVSDTKIENSPDVIISQTQAEVESPKHIVIKSANILCEGDNNFENSENKVTDQEPRHFEETVEIEVTNIESTDLAQNTTTQDKDSNEVEDNFQKDFHIVETIQNCALNILGEAEDNKINETNEKSASYAPNDDEEQLSSLPNNPEETNNRVDVHQESSTENEVTKVKPELIELVEEDLQVANKTEDKKINETNVKSAPNSPNVEEGQLSLLPNVPEETNDRVDVHQESSTRNEVTKVKPQLTELVEEDLQEPNIGVVVKDNQNNKDMYKLIVSQQDVSDNSPKPSPQTQAEVESPKHIVIKSANILCEGDNNFENSENKVTDHEPQHVKETVENELTNIESTDLAQNTTTQDKDSNEVEDNFQEDFHIVETIQNCALNILGEARDNKINETNEKSTPGDEEVQLSSLPNISEETNERVDVHQERSTENKVTKVKPQLTEVVEEDLQEPNSRAVVKDNQNNKDMYKPIESQQDVSDNSPKPSPRKRRTKIPNNTVDQPQLLKQGEIVNSKPSLLTAADSLSSEIKDVQYQGKSNENSPSETKQDINEIIENLGEGFHMNTDTKNADIETNEIGTISNITETGITKEVNSMKNKVSDNKIDNQDNSEPTCANNKKINQLDKIIVKSEQVAEISKNDQNAVNHGSAGLCSSISKYADCIDNMEKDFEPEREKKAIENENLSTKMKEVEKESNIDDDTQVLTLEQNVVKGYLSVENTYIRNLSDTISKKESFHQEKFDSEITPGEDVGGIKEELKISKHNLESDIVSGVEEMEALLQTNQENSGKEVAPAVFDEEIPSEMQVEEKSYAKNDNTSEPNSPEGSVKSQKSDSEVVLKIDASPGTDACKVIAEELSSHAKDIQNNSPTSNNSENLKKEHMLKANKEKDPSEATAENNTDEAKDNQECEANEEININISEAFTEKFDAEIETVLETSANEQEIAVHVVHEEMNKTEGVELENVETEENSLSEEEDDPYSDDDTGELSESDEDVVYVYVDSEGNEVSCDEEGEIVIDSDGNEVLMITEEVSTDDLSSDVEVIYEEVDSDEIGSDEEVIYVDDDGNYVDADGNPVDYESEEEDE